MASDNKCPTLIKWYGRRAEKIIPENGVPFLTGTKVLCWRPEVLPTCIRFRRQQNRSGPGNQLLGKLWLLPEFSFQLRFPECALQKYTNYTAGGNCRHRPKVAAVFTGQKEEEEPIINTHLKNQNPLPV